MTAQYPGGLAIDDQFTESARASIDDRSCCRVEANDRDDGLVSLTRRLFGKSNRRILRIRKAARWTHALSERHDRASHGVRGRQETVLYRLRDEHQPAGHVASCENV